MRTFGSPPAAAACCCRLDVTVAYLLPLTTAAFRSLPRLPTALHPPSPAPSLRPCSTQVGTQRRAVLEAVAYGCFLRDVESWVDTEYELLTPVAAAGGAGMDD